MFFQWAQSKHIIPARWTKLIIKYSDVDGNDHVIKGARIYHPKKYIEF